MTLGLHPREGTPTRTVERALALLSQVCDTEAISLTDCARGTHLPTSTALRLLRTMELAGFVIRREDGMFTAGPHLLQIGAMALGHSSLAKLAEPALHRIVAATRESAYLSVRGSGDGAVYIAMVEGTHSVRHTSWVGRSVPMTGLAVGHALLGDVPDVGYRRAAGQPRARRHRNRRADPPSRRRGCGPEPSRSDVPHRRRRRRAVRRHPGC